MYQSSPREHRPVIKDHAVRLKRTINQGNEQYEATFVSVTPANVMVTGLSYNFYTLDVCKSLLE